MKLWRLFYCYFTHQRQWCRTSFHRDVRHLRHFVNLVMFPLLLLYCSCLSPVKQECANSQMSGYLTVDMLTFDFPSLIKIWLNEIQHSIPICSLSNPPSSSLDVSSAYRRCPSPVPWWCGEQLRRMKAYIFIKYINTKYLYFRCMGIRST